MASRWKNQWVELKQFGDETFLKCKILSTFKEFGNVWYRVESESGYLFNIPVDSVLIIGESKKARVIPIRRKIKLVSKQS